MNIDDKSMNLLKEVADVWEDQVEYVKATKSNPDDDYELYDVKILARKNNKNS